ncbi:MAG: CPBP family intramembrane glutamic endopeptidase, partial [Terriglobales bacterium]
MAAESNNLISEIRADPPALPSEGVGLRTFAVDSSGLFEVGLVFGLIMIAVWTPPGHLSTIVSVVATLSILWFAVRGRYSVREMGLSRPESGTVVIFISGICMIVAVVFAGQALHDLGPAQPVPWERAWKYAIWALEQEFILQSFFYVRLESLLGSRRAVIAAALLFCATHVPSPLLTGLSLVGGLLFCEMFRRYRNIFPLG